ncbi:MAG: hypothetical protein ACRD0K_11125 [Egibacteraceae bacterium]
MQHNEGIWMSDSSITADVLAVGRGARATKIVTAPWADETASAQINDQLRELLACIERHTSDLDDADELRGSVGDVVAQLSKQRPNKTTVLGILRGIATAASSVSGVAAAVDAVTNTVSKLL